MRIISGRYKGRIITPPRNLRARPTTDFAKENLFNVLAGFGFDYGECDVLDLFAGTGSMSYEFASRGARSVTAVEINAVHHAFIRRMASEMGFTGLYPVKANVFNYLRACTRRFDIIFSDAPYDLKGSEEVISLVFERGLLRPEGVGDSGCLASEGPVAPESSGGSTSVRVGGFGASGGLVSSAPEGFWGPEGSAGDGEACGGSDSVDGRKEKAASGGSDSVYDGSTGDGEEWHPGGILIFEHSKEHNFASHPNFLQSRNYGSVQFSMFGA